MSTYESEAHTTMTTVSSGSPNLVVTKPSGLAEGDEMLAFIAGYHTGAVSVTFATPSGWSLVADTGVAGTNWRMYFYRKTADSSDVAASNFTFVASTSGTNPAAGAIIRISDLDGIADSGTGIDQTLTTPITGLSDLNALHFFAVATQATSVGSYAYATDNPTWTELFDVTANVVSLDHAFAIAYTTRYENSDSGNATHTGNNSAGIVVALNQTTDGSDTADEVDISFNIQGFFGFGQVYIASDTPTDAESNMPPSYINQTKNSVTWTNQSKT